MNDFKIGDSVVCIDREGYCFSEYLLEKEVYIIEDVVNYCDSEQSAYSVKLAGSPFWFDASRFELVAKKTEEVLKPQLTMSYGGTTITIDPNNPFSRKFADVLLNVVYGGE